MAGLDEITLRPMAEADIPLGMRLKELAGWNQTEADWRLLLSLSRGGSFVACCGSAEVATLTTATYDGKLGWIGMVLVDPAYRRRGIATQLVRAAISAAEPSVALLGLDATRAGRPLYEGLGFAACGELLRMTRPAAALEESETPCEPITAGELPALAAFDAPLFGARRQAVLRDLWLRLPQSACALRREGRLVGYVLSRSGSASVQIGPLVAPTIAESLLLLRAALRPLARHDTHLDVPTDQHEWIAALEELGFVASRPFTRMTLGGAPPLGQSRYQLAVAGPELG